MKLLFDLNATQPNGASKRHGGGRYGEVIFQRMIERGIEFSCFYDSRKWINPDIRKSCIEHGIVLHDLKDNGIEDIIRQNRIERLYSCLPRYLSANISGLCEVYGTIHGLRTFEIPHDRYFYRYRSSLREKIRFCGLYHRYWVEKERRCFEKLFIESPFRPIVVSNHTHCSLLSHFPKMAAKNIPVLYSPCTSSADELEKDPAAGKYFLLVSGNRWEKNNLRAIMAFDRLISSGRFFDIRMKVAGSDGCDFKYKIRNPERFDFLGYVEDTELERLYANAYSFVYPSLNEGFGYPPLEAMRYSVPVIASPFSAVSEICGGGALYFNPFSVEEIMNRMVILLTDSDIYREYSQSGHERYQHIKARQDRDLELLIDLLVSHHQPFL